MWIFFARFWKFFLLSRRNLFLKIEKSIQKCYYIKKQKTEGKNMRKNYLEIFEDQFLPALKEQINLFFRINPQLEVVSIQFSYVEQSQTWIAFLIYK